MQAHDSASSQEAVVAWEQEVQESKYAAGLPLLEEGLGRWGRRIPSDPGQWACESSGVRDNLWLNLSTGYVGSGRAVGAPGRRLLSRALRGHPAAHSEQSQPAWRGLHRMRPAQAHRLRLGLHTD